MLTTRSSLAFALAAILAGCEESPPPTPGEPAPRSGPIGATPPTAATPGATEPGAAPALPPAAPAPAPTAAPVRPAPEAPTGPREPFEIEVCRGESMGLYGRWARIAMDDLYERVGLRWNERLDAGRRLRLPLAAAERARFTLRRAEFHRGREAKHLIGETREHVVRRGDNPWRIGRKLGAPVWVLERLNPGRDLSRLRVGERIRVPAVGPREES